MGRSPCCDGVGLKRGPWTAEEDQKLLAYIQGNGHGSWRTLPQKAGLQRCGKSCRLRWINYLRPDIKRGQFTTYEEQRIIQLHALLGNRWSVIAAHLPNRTDNEIKNYWNTHIKKRLTKMGIDPVTHKKKQTLSSSSSSSNNKHMNLSVIDHIAQWESTRLEAEARLAKESSNVNGILSGSRHQLERSAKFGDGSLISPSFDILKAWQSGYGGNPKGQPYTLSFLEATISVLASRESNNLMRANSEANNFNGYDDDNSSKKCDLWSSSSSSPPDGYTGGENYVIPKDGGGDFVFPCNIDEWNIPEENCWNEFSTSPEGLYSLVF